MLSVSYTHLDVYKRQNWYRLIKSLWTDIDDGVRKTLFENFIVNSALIGFPKECDNREKYGLSLIHI